MIEMAAGRRKKEDVKRKKNRQRARFRFSFRDATLRVKTHAVVR
jgi:hypothetical protein